MQFSSQLNGDSWTFQRNAAGSRGIQQLTVAFDGGADIRITYRAAHHEVYLSPEE
jgi:hypothetical protein